MPDQDLLASLRTRLAQTPDFPWEPEWPLHPEQNSASVLIALAPGAQGLSVLLTRRTDHLHHHPGQICFPGGRVESTDTSPIETALRETEEEIGLAREQIELLGTLPDYATSSGFRVTPVVGLVSPNFTPKLDAFEVAELFSVPLRFVLHTGNYQRHRVQRQGSERQFFAVPYSGRFIWGATAGMLAMFAACMGSKQTPDTRQNAPTDLRTRPVEHARSSVYSG